MIQIDVKPEFIHIHGHAGAAPHGFSVPCEAVTVLCNMIVASFGELTNELYKVKSFKDGEFLLDIKALSADSALLVKAFLLTLQGVAEAYPQYISMTKH